MTVTPPMQIAIAVICFILMIKGIVKAFKLMNAQKEIELTEPQKQAIHYKKKYGPITCTYSIMADILKEKRQNGESAEYHFLLQVQKELKK